MTNLAPHRFVFVFLLCCFLLGLAGCGGGSSSNMAPTPTPTPLPFFSGLYQIDSSSSLNSAVTFSVAGSLEQSGNNVTGVMHLTAASCSSFNTDIPVNGTLGTDSAGDFTVTLALTLPGGQALALNMIHPGGHLSIVSGTYTLAGVGCAGPAQGFASGNVMGITGTASTGTAWRGSLTSNSGPVSQINLSMTQTGPDAHGFFSATGTGTITGGTCFSAFTIDPSSIVIGEGSTLVLTDSQSGVTGTLSLQGTFAPLPFGGATFVGTYTSTQGTCSDAGSADMSFS
jgi:hypothetical protein